MKFFKSGEISFKISFLLFFSALFFSPLAVSAANVGFVGNNIWVSDQNPLAGEVIKISSVIINDDPRSFFGTVSFYDNGALLGAGLGFSLGSSGESRVLSIGWAAVRGEHRFRAEIGNAYFTEENGAHTAVDSSMMSQTTGVIFVDVDEDADGLPNRQEEAQGTSPTNPDTDGDGDNDGSDPGPVNPRIFSGADTDRDGISDAADTDIDNDGLYNWEEEKIGTDQKKYDTDEDGYSDKEDEYPLDRRRYQKAALAFSVGTEETSSVDSGLFPAREISSASSTEEINHSNTGVPAVVLGEKIYAQGEGSGESNKLLSKEFLFFGAGFLVLLLLLLFRVYEKMREGRKTRS